MWLGSFLERARMTQESFSAGYLDLVQGRRRGMLATLARAGLACLAVPYRLGMGVRAGLYGVGLLRRHRLPVPVISVGNLSLGGTGKTPMVALLAERLLARGHRVAVLSRGYGRTGDGDDEAILPEAPADRFARFTGASRAVTGRRATTEFGATRVLLDDGFQHWALVRDLDVVLVDATQPPGEGRLFPRGLLREPPSALARAGFVVLTRTDQASAAQLDAARAEAERRTGRAPAEAVHAPAGICNWPDGVREPIERISGTRVFGFCGIGNPEAFRRTLTACGAVVTGFRAFPDHHGFSATDREEVSRAAEAAGADWLITTAKDALRLTNEWQHAARPIRIVEVKMTLVRHAEPLWGAVDALGGPP